MKKCTLALLMAVSAPTMAAPIVANSVADFSGVQGFKNWYYGYFRKGQPTSPIYTPSGFHEYDTFGLYGNSPSWWDSVVQLGSGTQRYPSWRAQGGHPAGLGPDRQNEIVWSMLRYEAPTAGFVNISYHLAKENVVNPKGGGITGFIYVDGRKVFVKTIANADATGVSGVLLHIPVHFDSVIDFAISPLGFKPLLGTDSLYSARSDATIFTSTITLTPSLSLLSARTAGLSPVGDPSPVNEPSGIALALAGLFSITVFKRGPRAEKHAARME